MVSIEELDKIASRNQTTLSNVYREYCQNLFLSFLYQEPNSNYVQFKGGTALRIYYKSPRYSEDLDFSLFEITRKQVEDIMINTIENLDRANLNPELEESKETSGGYLSNLYLTVGNQKVKIAIQASRRKISSKQANITLIDNEFIPAYTVFLLNEKDLIAEKLEAAITRSKPRDFFDVYFLLRKGVLTVENKKLLKSTAEIVEKSRINFKKELEDFLPKNMHAITANFQAVYRQEIQKYIN